MVTDLDEMEETKSYHHGDLRRALLEAARAIIRDEGAAALTLRGVARAAGVSHAAPYHHFKDKGALLAAVAEEGFIAFRAFVEARAADASTPALALQERAIGYVVFAIEEAELFRVMFGPQLADKSSFPTLRGAAAAAYSLIGDLFETDASSKVERSWTGDAAPAVASWALIHGLAMLLIDGQFGEVSSAEAETLARAATDVFWLGLSSLPLGSSTPSTSGNG
jgi:AcrR family transcriptional regulator